MKNFSTVVVFIMMCLVVAVCANAGEKVLKVVGEAYPPLTNPDGTGVQFEVARAVYEPLGYDVQTLVYPYKRAVWMVETGKASLVVGSGTNGNDACITSSMETEVPIAIAVYPKCNTREWKGIHSLEKKRLSWIRGYDWFGETLNDLHISYNAAPVDRRKQAYSKLLAERDDFFLDTKDAYDESMRNSSLKEFQGKLAYKEVGYIPVFCTFTNNESGKKLKKIWDDQYPKLWSSGKLHPIYQKWNVLEMYLTLEEYRTWKKESEDIPAHQRKFLIFTH